MGRAAVALLRKLRHRGGELVDWIFAFTAIGWSMAPPQAPTLWACTEPQEKYDRVILFLTGFEVASSSSPDLETGSTRKGVHAAPDPRSSIETRAPSSRRLFAVERCVERVEKSWGYHRA
jgi:hypothetical protein